MQDADDRLKPSLCFFLQPVQKTDWEGKSQRAEPLADDVRKRVVAATSGLPRAVSSWQQIEMSSPENIMKLAILTVAHMVQ